MNLIQRINYVVIAQIVRPKTELRGTQKVRRRTKDECPVNACRGGKELYYQ